MWHFERLKITSGESLKFTSFSREDRLLNLNSSPEFVRKVHLELVIYRIHLAVGGTLGELRALEELREDVKGFVKLLGLHIEEELSVVFPSHSVLASAIFSEELRVIRLVWILLGAQEEHMLAEMGKSVDLKRVVETT